jgi:DNA-binding GntR family transcriptional regulator
MAHGESLTQTAYERIRADLLACRMRPGARVSIVDVAGELDVSPGAVREALSRLTAEGLVALDPQRGFRVAEVSASDLRDLTSVRVQIEQLCLRSSIAHGGVSWESHLVAMHHVLTRTPEREPDDEGRLGDAWSKSHAAFHEALVAACDSRYLLEIRHTLYARSERYRRLSIPLARRERDTAVEHRAMLDAALARDADRAASLLAEHLETTAAILIDALVKSGPEDSTAAPRPRGRSARRQAHVVTIGRDDGGSGTSEG